MKNMQSIHYLFLIISVTNAVPFTLTSGDGCELVDHSGKQCFQSQNYPANYDYSQVCTITMNQAGILNVVDFDVGARPTCAGGFMTIDSLKYCGRNSPDSLEVAIGDTIKWNSQFATFSSEFQNPENFYNFEGVHLRVMICYRNAVCPNFNGITINDGPCSCGSSDCTSNNGLFCAKGISRCSTAPTNSCSNVNGNVANINSCQCGATSDCETAGMFCFSDYDFCKHHPKCTDIYGSTENNIDCTCGSAHCGASTGRFCMGKLNQCTSTMTPKDGFTSNDELKEAVNLYLSDESIQANKDASIGKYGELPEWDVSRITHMRLLFAYLGDTLRSGDRSVILERGECCDLSKWNVGKTTDFSAMFYNHQNFNSDLSKW